MFELVFGMELGLVNRVGLPHFPEDFEPSLAEASEGAGMTFALAFECRVVGLSPRAVMAAFIDP